MHISLQFEILILTLQYQKDIIKKLVYSRYVKYNVPSASSLFTQRIQFGGRYGV